MPVIWVKELGSFPGAGPGPAIVQASALGPETGIAAALFLRPLTSEATLRHQYCSLERLNTTPEMLAPALHIFNI